MRPSSVHPIAADPAAELPIMEARGLRLRENAEPFDFALHPGRVLGVAGLEGHGQERLLEVISGQAAAAGGEIMVRDERAGNLVAGPRSLQRAFDQGIVYVPRDRKTQGIMPGLSVLENFAVATLGKHATAGILRPREIRRRYEEFAERLGIVADSAQTPIRALSGGNQQKVLLARWLAAGPRVLLLNDPSRGVDHRTRVSLYDVYREVAADGAAVVLLSTEIEELVAIGCDVAVFRDYTVSARIAAEDVTRERILAAMFGGHHDEA